MTTSLHNHVTYAKVEFINVGDIVFGKRVVDVLKSDNYVVLMFNDPHDKVRYPVGTKLTVIKD